MKKAFTLALIIPAFALSIATATFAEDAMNTAAAPTMTAPATKADAQKAVAADKKQLKADQAALATAVKSKDKTAIAAARATVAADKKQWKADVKTLASFHKAKKASSKAADKNADTAATPAKN